MVGTLKECAIEECGVYPELTQLRLDIEAGIRHIERTGRKARQCSPPTAFAPSGGGFLFSGLVSKSIRRYVPGMAQRVVVFIDYQNVYKGARESFGFGKRSWNGHGQIWPRKIGDLIARNSLRSHLDRKLEQVRVYRGVPSDAQRPKAYAAARAQIEAWERDPLVDVNPHTLQRVRGNEGQPERLQEKGVDVNLAVDFVDGAHKGEFDIGVIFSTDTDFLSALEKVRELGIVVETASWWAEGHRTKELGQKVKPTVWNNRLDREDYRRVRDLTDYTR